jgi:hypothetical protein
VHQTDVFVLDLDYTFVSKVFHQAAGKGESGIVDGALWIVFTPTSRRNAMVIKPIQRPKVTECQRLGSVPCWIKNAAEYGASG